MQMRMARQMWMARQKQQMWMARQKQMRMTQVLERARQLTTRNDRRRLVK
jgi:hypothetical protein